MTICFFGNYIKDYPRIKVLTQGLRGSGVRVLECHTRKRGLGKYRDLFRQHWKLRGGYDALLVGMGGQTLVWFARILTRKPVFFDAFTSLYLTNVEDRKTCSPDSMRARYYAFLDRLSCRMAEKVLLDTNAQIDYFVSRYDLPREKFFRIFVGADSRVYFPSYPSTGSVSQTKPRDKFIVHWHGHIVPFHGLNTVVAAAEALAGHEDIEFQIITRFNSKFEAVKETVKNKNLKNIRFFPEMSQEKLANSVNNADVCLGVFGSNKKAAVVIPNKIFEAVACAKPSVTARHEVILELFTDRQNIILVDPENSKKLAEEILNLKNDEAFRKKISRHAFDLYQTRLTPKVLGQELKNVLFPRDAQARF